jgi:hypothetical protein
LILTSALNHLLAFSDPAWLNIFNECLTPEFTRLRVGKDIFNIQQLGQQEMVEKTPG